MKKKLLYYLIILLTAQKSYGQSLDLISPNGGENWPVGSTQSIQWTYSNVNFIKIDYSVDGGLTYLNIVSSYSANANSYQWTVPANVSSNCLIKISDFYNTISDQSSNQFTISNDPFIDLTSLNGGEILTPGSDTLITWDALSISPTVKIEYSGNNGLNWILITDNYPNNNSYQWTIPNTPSNECLVKVSDAQNNLICDSSNASFYIVPLSSPIELISPNGGQSWPIGYQQTIQWYSGSIANVNIEITYDNGANWNMIESSYPATDGYYLWTVAAPNATTLAKIKISDALDPNVYDESNFAFSLFLPPPTLDLFYPNGGESIAEGMPIDILWNSVNVNTITIEYSINNGLNWQIITTNANAALGSYTWTAPNTGSNSMLIRLTDNSNSSIIDQSSSTFSLITPEIFLQNFPSGSTFDIYTNLNINWSSNAVNSGLLKLEYSINNGINWIVFANGIPNTGLYQWVINCPPADSCKIKISLQGNPNIFCISNGAIKIIASNPTLVVLSPTAQEVIGSGTTYQIKWFSYAINYVRIEYSINGDTIFNLISPFAPAINGVYYWQVPANLNAINCRIKISNAANTNFGTTNAGVFSIELGNISITSGNSPTTLIAGTTHQIIWSNFGTSNYVNILYSIDSLNWIPIVNNYSNSGFYEWDVPYINTDSILYKVSDFAINSIFDINDAYQKIIIPNPLIELLTPQTGSTFIANSEIDIQWVTGGIDSINIEYSIDAGLSWISIVNNLSASNTSFLWSIGNNLISGGLLRISNSADSLIYDLITFNVVNPSLNILSPNGGENLITGNFNYITWESFGIDYVNLYYSSNNGIDWNPIDTNVFNLGYYNWSTGLTGNNFLIKVLNADFPTMVDESDSVFSLNTPTQSISLLSPNGNEMLTIGTGAYIDWQSSGISNIDIYYSLDGGINYIPIANNVPSIPSFYYWQVPDTTSNTVKIKINKTGNPSLFSISALNFSIVTDNPSINVISPNGGEQIIANSFYTILWNANNCNYVNIYYSIDGGFTYIYLNSALGVNSYNWNIPNVSSSNCKIKIANALDSNIYDISDLNFQILSVPFGSQIINIDSLASNSFCSGSSFTINYNVNNTFNPSNHFRVHLSNNLGNFNSFTDIGGNSSSNSGSILCQIPKETISGGNYTIRIVADNPPVIGNTYNYGGININKANADFYSDKTLVLLPNELVNLTPVISNSFITNSNWILNNNMSYSNYAPAITFNQPDKIQVIHEIDDVNGCSDTVSKPEFIYVEDLFFNQEIITPHSDDLIDIDFENSRYGCAIFKNGNCIITSDSGKTWNIAYTNINNTQLNSITIYNNNWLIGLGDGGYLKSVDKGNTWNHFTFNNLEAINDMIYTDPSSIISVCNNGKIKKFNGTIWQNQNSGTVNNLNKIDHKNNTIIIAGDNATILKYQNSSWTSIQSPISTNLNDIMLKDSIEGYIAADFGYILKTVDGGITWNVTLSGADIDFNNVVCSGDSVWAIGSNGIIYTSIDNGQNWKRFSVGSLNNLNALVYMDEKGFIAGNDGLLREFNNKKYFPLIDGVNQIIMPDNIKCFPNPTANFVNIELNNSNSSSVSFCVYNIHGKKLFESRENTTEISSIHQIDLRSFADGVYFITVVLNGKYQTFKIVKSK
jgi:photosystem II stability/assembly factor-like uncharacterized protein